MPRTLLQSVVRQLQRERNQLELELRGITEALRAFGRVYSGKTSSSARVGRRGRRKMSAAARAKIAKAQRARWAKVRAARKAA
jgi:hypothetical protein